MYFPNIVLIVSAALTMGACVNDDPVDSGEDGMLIESITADGNSWFSLTYTPCGKVKEYRDAHFDSTFIVKYDPLTVTLIDKADEEGDSERVMEFYDMELNDLGYVSSYKGRQSMRSTDGTVTPMGEWTATATYDATGHLLTLKQGESDEIRLDWDADGRLLSSSFGYTVNTYQSTDIPYTGRQWIPIWYGLGGLEMTGLFGAPPAYLIAEGIQTFPDTHLPESLATFDYTLSADGLIESLVYSEDSNQPVRLQFNYTK